MESCCGGGSQSLRGNSLPGLPGLTYEPTAYWITYAESFMWACNDLTANSRVLPIRPKISRFPVRNWMERSKFRESFGKFRNTYWVHPLWWNFRSYRKFCVPFARNVDDRTKYNRHSNRHKSVNTKSLPLKWHFLFSLEWWFPVENSKWWNMYG